MSMAVNLCTSSFLSYSSPSLQNSSRSSPSLSLPRSRFSCSASSSPPHHDDRKVFTDFPYISGSLKDLMMDLVSIVENRIGSILNPCSLPLDVQSYHNETGTAYAALDVRSGVQSSQIDLILGSWIYSELPSGGALNITNLLGYPNSSTDAPSLLIELIQNSPTSIVIALDLPPRKDLILYPDYLKTYYEDTQLDRHRQHLVNLSEVKPYISGSLYIRSLLSPTAILVLIETESLDEMIKTHVTPMVKQVLNIWLDFCDAGETVASESERDYLKKRDGVSRSKGIEIDLESSLPRLFGRETANRVIKALMEVL